MSYENDKHKIRKLYEQNQNHKQELDKLTVPTFINPVNNTLKKIKKLSKNSQQVIPISRPYEFIIVTGGKPAPFPGIRSLGNQIAKINLSGLQLFGVGGGIYQVQITGVLDKLYRITMVDEIGLDENGRPIFVPGIIFSEEDRHKFQYGSTYSYRVRQIITGFSSTNRVGEWSQIFQFEVLPKYPIPEVYSPLYMGYKIRNTASYSFYLLGSEAGFYSSNGININDWGYVYTGASITMDLRTVDLIYDNVYDRWFYLLRQLRPISVDMTFYLQLPYWEKTNWSTYNLWEPIKVISRGTIRYDINISTGSINISGTMTDAVEPALTPPDPLIGYQTEFHFPGVTSARCLDGFIGVYEYEHKFTWSDSFSLSEHLIPIFITDYPKAGQLGLTTNAL